MNKHCFGVSALALLVASQAAAQEATHPLPVTELKEIIVSGGLSPIEQRKSGRSISVIDGALLEQNNIKYAVDALRLVPGVAVSRSGSTGGQTVVRMRGSEANQVLVVVDGIVINDVDQGAAYFENLLASDIEQIEVLRGPQSALWGSNAMGGVINITTKTGENGKPKSSVTNEIGTNGQWLGSLATRGGSDHLRYSLGGTFKRTNKFNISEIGNEDDRDRIANLNGKLSLDLNDATTLDTVLRYVDRKSDYDDTDFLTDKAIDAENFLKERTFSGAVGLTNIAMDGALTQRIDLTARDQTRDSFDSFGAFLSDSKRYTAGYNATYRYDDIADQVHQFTGGYEWLREAYISNFMDGEASRSSHSAIAEYRGEFSERFFITAGLRNDWNTNFSDATTWNISADWKFPSQEIRLHSAVGTAVTKPTFYEQFANSSIFVGNPNLKPEESFGWDLGIEKTFLDRGVILDVTYFNQNLTDEISGSGRTVVNNDGESRRHGIEVSATIDFFNGLSSTASYTYTDATNQKLATDARLAAIRRPRHAGSLTAAYVFAEDRARIFGELTINGSMPDEGYTVSRVKLDTYTLVNVGGSYKVSDTVDIFARVDNLFDTAYTEVYGYNTPGITGFAGIKASF
jgi:vitamin B12 transporter